MWSMMVVFLLASGPDSPTASWQQWRGPQRDGAVAAKLPAVLPEQLRQVWRMEVGEGFGSPVAKGRHLFVPVRKAGREWLLCVDARTGTLVWERDFQADFKPNPYATKYGEGPFATPAISGERLVLVTVTGQVHCLDPQSGNTLWQQAFDSELTGDRVLFCGNTTSPLMMENQVVVHVGDETHGHMAAFELATGKLKWRWAGDIAGYASPILARFDGVAQIVSITQNKIVGIHPQNGNLLWEFPWQVQWRENIVMPLQHGNGIIVSGREQGATLKLQVAKVGSQWQVKEVWRNEDLPMYMSSPVIVDDHLIGLSHKRKGQFFRMNASNGQALWQGPGRTGQNAALLAFADHVLALTTSGDVILFDATAPTYSAKATYKVSDSETWAHPLWHDKTLYVKDRLHLTAWKFR